MSDALITVVVALLSSGGLWTFLQFVVGRRAEAARREAEKQDRNDERKVLLADAQAVAQQTALDSAGRALALVNQRCDTCFDELHALRGAAENLIDSIEVFVADESPANRRSVRAMIRALRQVL